MDVNKEIEHLKKQVGFLELLVRAINSEHGANSELISVIGPMLLVNMDSLESIVLLAEKARYRDVLILSRPFLEGTINVGFICAEGEEAVNKSKRYAYQKGYRDLFRSIDINGFKIESGLVDFAEQVKRMAPEHLKEALDDYSTKGGKEVMSWTPETTKEKLERIGKVYGPYVNTLLTFAFFSIYRDASEIIHNTYYGIRIYTGMQRRDLASFTDHKAAAKYFGEHQERLGAIVLQQLNVSVNALLNVLNQKLQLQSTAEIFEQSNRALVEYANSFNKSSKTTGD